MQVYEQAATANTPLAARSFPRTFTERAVRAGQEGAGLSQGQCGFEGVLIVRCDSGQERT